jgi:hypothetical protein
MPPMAAAKPVANIPRVLLPRLTYTTTSLVQPAPHLLLPPAKLQSRPLSVPIFSPAAQSRSIHTILARHNQTPRPRYSRKRRRTYHPVLGVDSAPIRHNGVYAATFKPARAAFSTTVSQQKAHHFDTLKFVQRLKDENFTEEQAVAMMRVLNDVIEESIQNLTRTMVLKEDAERSTYTQKVDFAKLRSELSNADSTEAQLTRSSHDRLTSDLAKLNSRLRDEISRTQASVRLDLNLEKGRIREEANGQEMRIKETEARIEQEVASLRERVEAVKFSTLQWLM